MNLFEWNLWAVILSWMSTANFLPFKLFGCLGCWNVHRFIMGRKRVQSALPGLINQFKLSLTVKFLGWSSIKFSFYAYCFFIPYHTIVAGYYGFTLVVCLYFHVWTITSKYQLSIDIVEIWFGIANATQVILAKLGSNGWLSIRLQNLVIVM